MEYDVINPNCDLMGQNQSHMLQFFHNIMNNIMVYLTPVLGQIQCFKLVKIRSQYRVCVQSNCILKLVTPQI